MDSDSRRLYGNSRSMPILPSYTNFEGDREEREESPWAQVLREIQRSPGYELLTENDNPASPFLQRDAAESSTGCLSASENGEDTEVSSISSDETIKPRKESKPEAGLRFSALHTDQEQTATAPAFGAVGDKYLVHRSAQPSSPRAPTFQTTVPTSKVELPQAAHFDAPYKGSPMDHSGNLLHQNNDHKDDPFVSPTWSNCNDFHLGTMSLNDNKTAGSWAPAAYDSTPGTPTARRSLHHRHRSSNFSFIPVQPSKLGPGHFVDDLGSDVSGLVSPVSAAPQSQRSQNPHTKNGLRPKLPALQLPQSIPTSWTQSTPDSYSPFDMSAANDPFLEHTSHQVTLSNNYSPHRRKASTSTTPHSPHTFQHELPHPPTNLPPQATNPIPRPPLLTDQSVKDPDPQASARSAAHKARRQEWIQNETRNLTAAARAAANAKEKYNTTGTAEDYNAWLEAQAVCEETWSVARLTEGRRNLTLPEGMRAMKTGPHNLPSDGMAGGNGLLGFRMALMERLCAEVVAGKEEPQVPMEQLDDYSKKAVRSAVVRDVKGWTEERKSRREGGEDMQRDGEGGGGEF